MNFSTFIKRFYPYLRPNIGKLTIVSITMILATSLEAYLPEITGKIIDNLFKESNTKDASFYAFMIFGIIFLSSTFAFISTNISSIIANRVIMILRIEMFAKLLKLPKKYFDNNDTGKILSKLTYDTEQISAIASTIWINLIKSLLMVVILTAYLFWTSWQLSLSLIIILPLIFITVKKSSYRIKQASTIVQQSIGETTHHLSENITANVIVKVYQTYNSATKKFNKLANIIRQKRFRVDNIAALNTFVVNTLIGLSLAFVVYFSATSLNMSAGEFMSFFTAMGMLIKPAKTLVNINKPLQQALAAGESVFGLLDEIKEQEAGKEIKISGDIEFKNVNFSYNKIPVLKDVSFKINQGESLALVGNTGSGKSTIAQLILRLYSCNSGSILIDGHAIDSLNLDCLRKNISLVEQKTNLFTGSIRDNIALEQDLSIVEINKIISSANADEFINSLEKGLEDRIGNNGVTLSGGQAQRLSIARAMAKNAPILILDEATSALDTQTESLVQEAIDKLQTGKTTIIIAHRLSTIINADKIAVLKNGQIVEIGSHQELVAKNGEYTKLYKQQIS